MALWNEQYVGTSADLTEREASGEALALRSFAVDNARDAIFFVDEQARFIYVNEEPCRILGYGREELLGMGVPDVNPDFPAGRVRRAYSWTASSSMAGRTK